MDVGVYQFTNMAAKRHSPTVVLARLRSGQNC